MVEITLKIVRVNWAFDTAVNNAIVCVKAYFAGQITYIINIYKEKQGP